MSRPNEESALAVRARQHHDLACMAEAQVLAHARGSGRQISGGRGQRIGVHAAGRLRMNGEPVSRNDDGRRDFGASLSQLLEGFDHLVLRFAYQGIHPASTC
jgi:hypothetical protein